jgi:hypothetical protein
MDLYVVYEVKPDDLSWIIGIFDTEEGAIKHCTTKDHSYNKKPIQLNRSYQDFDEDPEWAFPL